MATKHKYLFEPVALKAFAALEVEYDPVVPTDSLPQLGDLVHFQGRSGSMLFAVNRRNITYDQYGNTEIGFVLGEDRWPQKIR